ncbi:ankyrin repeat domain-containing protein SOWAHB [Cervus elaphus]|uniref:ankyrin repeat domain-containing protein SOWAHB n=1 Tax=Cervus elaphus TaxID=9860 RepID=UPI001CC2739C|nr:ankyrin repeat domain-containing protein SOWAHB [Cervus elaphus]
MARELSQEALLDFLCQAGGRVTNAALLSHFKSFLRDPDAPPGQQQRRRELFKGFVNSVAAVRQDPDGTKFVVLKRRYRDLVGEEEGLRRPRDPPAAAAPAGGAAPRSPLPARRGEQPPQPQPGRRIRREEAPAGAAARVADAGCNGLPAGGAREAARGGGRPRGRSGHRAPVSAAAVAAAETQGRCCWECLQNGLGGLPDPASASAAEKPAQDDRGAPRPQREGAPAEPPPRPAAPRSPPATVEAAAAPAVLSSPSPPGGPPAPVTPGPVLYSTLQQQQQRTREWVAGHPQVPEARDHGPVRAWSVLPDDFARLPSEQGSWVQESESAPLGPLPPSQSLVAPTVSEAWSGDSPLAVFRSIRCQLSLQDLEDFVEQESHGSEESSSGPRESPGGSEDGLRLALGAPAGRRLRNPAGAPSPKEARPTRSPQGLRNVGDAHTSQPISTGADGPAGDPQPLSWPAPKLRRSLRRSSRAGRAKLSSSDEECLEEDLLKRSRRPPRARKPSRVGAMSSPRVDAALTLAHVDVKAATSERDHPCSWWAPGGDRPTALVPHRSSEHKSSLVPLEAREHEWIVKLASGSWIRVLSLFWEDPQLALHKDFLTGYTALHWIAKHGALRALQDLVSSAQKAGVALDVNVKSSCGYTPLHLAAIHGHQGIIKLLVQRLASRVNIRDSSGKKPWQYLTRNTSGEIWQLLEAPRDKPIFPAYSLVRSSSPTRKAKSREVSRHVTRKTSLAALLKSQHAKWKLANQYEKCPNLREREEDSD